VNTINHHIKSIYAEVELQKIAYKLGLMDLLKKAFEDAVFQ